MAWIILLIEHALSNEDGRADYEMNRQIRQLLFASLARG
jgi:hypothetical protein